MKKVKRQRLEILIWVKKELINYFKKMRDRARGGFFLGTTKWYVSRA